jgi:Immunoglobulin-like domain of bacterial spore germination
LPKPIVLIGIAAIAAAVLGLLYFTALCACDEGTAAPSPTAAAGANAAVTPPVLPTACGPNPSPAVNVAPTEFGYRKLTSPVSEAPVSSPLRISGQANPFEGAYSVTIFDRQGLRVATQDYLKDNRSLDFNSTLAFEVARPMPACVWVHERSGRDGSPTNITQVPVLLLP